MHCCMASFEQYFSNTFSPSIVYHMGGVMVSVLVSIAGDRGFEPRSDQTKDYQIGI